MFLHCFATLRIITVATLSPLKVNFEEGLIPPKVFFFFFEFCLFRSTHPEVLFNEICTMHQVFLKIAVLNIFREYFQSHDNHWRGSKKKMVWHSTQRVIYLHIIKLISFSYFSFNFIRFEHIKSLPIIL